MIASVRFWRTIREHLPDAVAADDLAIRLRHEPPQARKRHMSWNVPLTNTEREIVEGLMLRPPTPYLAFCVAHHYADTLNKKGDAA